MKKIYLAGPMRGIAEFNFPAFFKAAETLRQLGNEVFNPAERDNKKHGVNIGEGNPTGSIEQAAAQHGFSLREALAADVVWICTNADTIALLPGWEKSLGAQAELAIA